jgi:hypothetical protein
VKGSAGGLANIRAETRDRNAPSRLLDERCRADQDANRKAQIEISQRSRYRPDLGRDSRADRSAQTFRHAKRDRVEGVAQLLHSVARTRDQLTCRGRAESRAKVDAHCRQLLDRRTRSGSRVPQPAQSCWKDRQFGCDSTRSTGRPHRAPSRCMMMPSLLTFSEILTISSCGKIWPLSVFWRRVWGR